MLASSSLALGIVACVSQSASALHIPARSVRVLPRGRTFASGHGFKTRPMSAANDASAGSTTYLTNKANNIYVTNITLGDGEFTVQLDTGSTDLVLVPDQAINPSLTVELDPQPNSTYGTGWMSGPLAWASLKFGDYSVDEQVFLNGTSEGFFDEAFFPLGIRGILGVSLNSGTSFIRDALETMLNKSDASNSSASVLTNVFLQYPELANITSVYLGRSEDGESTDESVFTIGEVYDGVQDYIKDIKPLSVFSENSWAVPVDGVTVNKMKVQLNSSVKGAPSGKSIALLDTGTSAALVSKDVLDVMYGSIAGAWWSDDMEVWVVPCLGDYPNVTFTFGGLEYSIHPLDLTDVNDFSDTYNFTVCTSAFSSLGFGNGAMDFLLGDSFLRNVYTVFDYGSIGSDGKVIEAPAVQMLSLAAADSDYEDYRNARSKTLASMAPEATKKDLEDLLSQIRQATDSDGDSKDGDDEEDVATDNVRSSASALSSSDDSSYQALIDKLDKFGPIVVGILGGIFVVLLGLLGVSIAACIRSGRSVGAARNVNPSYAPVPLRFKEGEYKDEERYHE